MQGNEKLLWLFKDVPYHQEKVFRSFEGGHHGVSIRVMRGVTYRVGQFKGHPFESTKLAHVGTGMLGLTTSGLYFSSREKGLKIPYDKIVAFEPYSDGVGVQRDAERALPQIFVTGNGWFVYNLVTTLAKL
ncbi:MAG: hypothetical protein FJ039_00005 [Chloroflexi bacterium]|nr:hypothetical protein [Chloroflexota bacterium]